MAMLKFKNPNYTELGDEPKYLSIPFIKIEEIYYGNLEPQKDKKIWINPDSKEVKINMNDTWESISLESDLSDFISKNNIEEYTPTSEYNPATKKYVDDEIYSLKLKYIEGTSDDDAYINTSALTLPNPPEGYENIMINIIYHDPNLNCWCPCVSYKASGNSIHFITGGPSYGVAVVVGGTDCYRCKNATWRCYYIQQKI